MVHPTAEAHAILRKETGEPIALRSERLNGARIVFNPVLVTAFASEDPDPSNLASLVVQTVQWIAGTGSPSSTPLASTSNRRGLSAAPNPFSPWVEIELVLPEHRAAREPVLHVVDSSGRRVRALIDGPRKAGSYRLRWDGTDDAGRPVPSGVYFAVLRSPGGESILKLTRLRRE